MILGDEATVSPMAKALADSFATVKIFEELPDDGFAPACVPDYLFISTDLGVFEINNVIRKAKSVDDQMRIVLIDPRGDFEFSASNLGAHSLLTLVDGAEELVAKYWSRANFLCRMM